MNYIGIDFGACNIKAVKISSTGKLQRLKLNKDQTGGNFIPNVVLYDKAHGKIEIKVGKFAKNSLDVENKVWQIKPKLTQKNWTKFIKNLDRDVTITEIVENIFVWLWQEIKNKLSNEEELEVAITVPVSFSELQKNLIKEAAIRAGVPVKAIINESFAAIFSVEDIDDDEQCILIFDIGGSTLDVSLCRIECVDDKLNITELAAAGLKFGGIDIDNGIFEQIFLVKYADSVKELIDTDTTGRFKNELMNLIENLKEEIFFNEEDEVSNIISDSCGNLHNFSLTRDEIISVLEKAGIKQKIIALLDDLLDDAQIDASEVTKVKFFGGTSSIDYFKDILTDYFNEDIFDDEERDVDEIYMSIAHGAAKYLFMNSEKTDIVIKNVIPYSIGLILRGNFNRLIKRNELSGFITPFKPLLISELNLNDWRIPVYQTFSNDFDLPVDSDEIIFIGDIELSTERYEAQDAILFKMQTSGTGKILMSFFEQSDDSEEPKLIEKKSVKLGG